MAPVVVVLFVLEVFEDVEVSLVVETFELVLLVEVEVVLDVVEIVELVLLVKVEVVFDVVDIAEVGAVVDVVNREEVLLVGGSTYFGEMMLYTWPPPNPGKGPGLQFIT